jgi:hypothetical protein
LTRPVPVESSRPPEPATGTRGTLAAAPFQRVARLAPLALGTPMASVTLADEHHSLAKIPLGTPVTAGERSAVEQVLCEHVITSGARLVCSGTRLDLRRAMAARRCKQNRPPGRRGCQASGAVTKQAS